MIVNQWVPAAHQGDAIGDSARRVRDMLRALGHVADIFAITIDDSLRHDIRPFNAEEATGGDLTIFHYALRYLQAESSNITTSHRLIFLRRMSRSCSDSPSWADVNWRRSPVAWT